MWLVKEEGQYWEMERGSGLRGQVLKFSFEIIEVFTISKLSVGPCG